MAPSTPSTPPPRPSSKAGASSASTKKAAKLAQRGRGKKVRFQGGTVFPLIVAIVLVLGIGTIVYARQSVPDADASPPTVNDHWHLAYGFYLCGEWYRLQGNAEQTQDYQQTGVHSHDDGVIHWHAFTARAVGRRADLGVFLDVYGVEIDDDSITFPDGQPINADTGVLSDQQEWIEGETTCDGEDGEVQVVVWDNFTDTGDGTTYITSFDDIRVTNDAMVMSIAFVPRDTEVPMPPWAQDLPELGAIDAGQTEPPVSTPGSSVPADSAPAGSTPTTVGEPSASTDADSVTATTTPSG